MPQQSLLPDHPAMTAYALVVRSFPHTKFPDEVDVSLQIAVGDGPLKTRQVVTLRGVECDYLDTLATETVSAYMYGETPADVARAMSDVRKQARAHGLAHSFG